MTYNCAIEDISVVIPTFNRRNLLKRAIHSVIKQTIEPREIIVIDNGSTDQTFQMVSSSFPDINYFTEKKTLIVEDSTRYVPTFKELLKNDNVDLMVETCFADFDKEITKILYKSICNLPVILKYFKLCSPLAKNVVVWEKRKKYV